MYPAYMYVYENPFLRHCRGVILKTSSQKMRIARDTVYECCMGFALYKYVIRSLLLAFAILNYAFNSSSLSGG